MPKQIFKDEITMLPKPILPSFLSPGVISILSISFSNVFEACHELFPSMLALFDDGFFSFIKFGLV